MEVIYIIQALASKLGMTEDQFGISLLFVILICNFISRLIPETSAPWLLIVKRITAAVGLYVSNRITSGQSVNDIIKQVASNNPPPAENQPTQEEVEAAADSPSAIKGVDPMKNPFRRDPTTGRFVALDKGADNANR